LLRLDARGTPRVEARVDESRAAHVAVGDRVEVLLTAVAAEPLPGTVTEVARAVDASTRAFTVKVALPEGTTATTGSFARVRFRGPERPALVVPASAIRRQGQVTSVFVVTGGAARLRLVQLGPSVQDGVEVLAGLDAGERVVLDPPSSLTDGTPIGAQP
jgi:RND family efflux transporter MFP subunit